MREVVKSLAFLLLGIVIGLYIMSFQAAATKFVWKNELGIEPIVNILIALGIAVFLTQSFQRVLEIKKFESAWAMDSLKEAGMLLRDMKLEFEGTYKSQDTRKQFLDKFKVTHRRFANQLTDTKELLDLLGYTKETNLCDDLQTKSFVYKSSVSGGDPNQPFDAFDCQKHDRNYAELRKGLMKLIIDLGRK